MHKLYYAPGAASLAVHWMLIEIGEPFETIALDMERKDHKSPDYLKINPAGLIPTLVVDGAPFAETAAILIWLAERHAQAGFNVEAPGPRREFLQTMFFLANGMQPAFRTWFYPEEAAGADCSATAKECARARIEAGWDGLDGRFADGRAFILGDKMSAPDFLLTMLARWSRNMPKPADGWPHLGAYIGRMKKRAGLIEVHRREGLTEWISG